MRLLYPALVRLLPLVPSAVLKRVASRYIAGETAAQAMKVVCSLAERRILTTVDLLGENLDSEASVREVVEEYTRLIDLLAAANVEEPEVSIKPTLLGLRLREALVFEELERVTRHAAERGVTVCVDMEDSSTTDATLRVFRALRERYDNVSVAIQAYLRRSVDDVRVLLPLRPRVRVCKGIYREPPSLAYRDPGAVRESFLALVRLLADGGGYPAAATHDPWLIERCRRLFAERGLGRRDYEFQMLLGVGEALQAAILAPGDRGGSRLRVYCPYGPEWRAYSARRFRENPRMVGFVLRDLLGRRVG